MGSDVIGVVIWCSLGSILLPLGPVFQIRMPENKRYARYILINFWSCCAFFHVSQQVYKRWNFVNIKDDNKVLHVSS